MSFDHSRSSSAGLTASVELLESRRLLASVAIDTTFGTSGGKTITDLNGAYDWANGMLVQPDGKIVITGNGSASDMIYAAVRYNPNGTLDTSFSSDGKLQLDGTYGWPGGVALQTDGKILLSGDLWDPLDEVEKMVIFRLNANGTLDTSFGSNGRVTYGTGWPYTSARGVYVMPDGKILFTGTINSNEDWLFLRYNANGTPDTTFGGGDGILTMDWGYRDLLGGLTFQSDGKIIVTGQRRSSSYGNAMGHVVRLKADFTPDTTFSGDGQLDLDWGGGFDGFNYPGRAQVLSDGRILISGSPGMARLMSNGSFDTSFDGDGKVIVPTQWGAAGVLIPGADGKFLSVGSYRYADYKTDVRISRFNANGTIDTTFDGDGTFLWDSGGNTYDEHVVGAFVDSQGRIVIGGERDTDGDYMVARFIEGTPPAATGSIAGTLWNDLDADGVKDSGEPGLSGWRVYVDADNDGVFDAAEKTALTSSTGTYTIAGLAAGTHRLREVIPGGWRKTYPSGSYHTVTLTDGQNSTGRNFGNTQKVRISGTLWNDTDGDGSKDSGEAGLSGWKVYLDTDKDGVHDSTERSYTTGTSGSYAFDNLAAGTYRVRTVLPSGWRRTSPTSSYVDKTLGNGATTTQNFGATQKILISGAVFNDLDGDRLKDSGEGGLSNWRVFIDTDGDGVWDSTEKSVLTSSSGAYSFNDLAAGTYRVRVVQQSGWTRTTPTSGYHSVTLSSGGSTSNRLFGERRIA